MSAVIQLYYGVVIAWGIYYLFASMSHELPWTQCEDCACHLYKYPNSSMETILNNTGYNCSETLLCFSLVR